jgi:type II secretory pathway pseudopilin PulG
MISFFKNGEAKRRQRRQRRRGLTLIEATMVLAIATVVVAGVLVFYSQSNTNSKVNEVMGQLNAIQSGVRSAYSGAGDYTGLDNAAIIGARVLPNKMIAGTNIRHALNGAVTIASADVAGGTANAFTVAIASVPRDACIRIMTMDMGSGVYDLTTTVSGAGTALASQAGTYRPRTPVEANTNCGVTATTITYTFI